jgi:hypothetical protein
MSVFEPKPETAASPAFEALATLCGYLAALLFGLACLWVAGSMRPPREAAPAPRPVAPVETRLG